VDIKLNNAYHLDCRKGLKLLKEQDISVDCIVTSPPYWKQRQYEAKNAVWDGSDECNHKWKDNFCQKCNAWLGQLGQEPTLELYIQHLGDVFDLCKIVLKDSGTLWIVIDDKFYNGNLMLIPTRLGIELISRGWICRGNIVWEKPNAYPESVNNRFSKDFETVLFFVKNNNTLFWANEKHLDITDEKPNGKSGKKGYDWMQERCTECNGKGKIVKSPKKKIGKYIDGTYRQKQKNRTTICSRCKGTGNTKYNLWKSYTYYFEQQFESLSQSSREDIMHRKNKCFLTGEKGGKTSDKVYNLKGRSRKDFYDLKHGKNKRSVWKIRTKPHTQQHFAIFPRKLIRLPIDSGCPKYICTDCGLPKVKIFDRKNRFGRRDDKYASCNCNADFKCGVVLDIFMGIGQTLIEAWSQGKDYIGFDISEKYTRITKQELKKKTSNKRIADYF
jgi:DNA modification methylase